MMVIGKIRSCVVAAAYELEVTEASVMGRSNRPEVVIARQLAMWAAAEQGKTRVEIGLVIDRNHSTITSACKKVRQRMSRSGHYHRLASNVLDLARRIYATKRAPEPVERQRRVANGVEVRSARTVAHAKRNHLGQHQGPAHWYEGRGAE